MPEITWVGPTPNKDEGRFGKSIDMIVLHYTANGTVDGAVSWFKNPVAQASVHYIVGKDGGVFQLVADEDTAWHAGVSGLRGWLVRPNRRSIGIEMINWGFLDKRGDSYHNWTGNEHRGCVVQMDGKYWECYTALQYESVAWLVRHLASKYNIPVQFPPFGSGVYHPRPMDLAGFRGVLGHSAISAVKSDPGPHFDWGCFNG